MPDTVCAHAAPSSTQWTGSLPPVAADELGFALTVFVAAANRRLMASGRGQAELAGEQERECERMFGDLLIHGSVVEPNMVRPYQASLRSAFSALWSEYSSHEMRDSICARVLCFHFLMERTRGKVVERWTSACPERPEEVLLSPAVVEGLASVPLDFETGLEEAHFVAAIGERFKTHYSA